MRAVIDSRNSCFNQHFLNFRIELGVDPACVRTRFSRIRESSLGPQ
jgi:hypothetical protein